MTRRFMSALAGLIIVIFVAGTEAQQQPPAFNGGAPVVARDAAAAPTTVNLLVGRSTIVDIGTSIARVSLTVPDVADAMVTAPTQLLVHGKSPGTISMFIWDRMGGIKTYEVIVRRDLSTLIEQVKTLFPGEPITIAGSGKDVILSGTVSGQYVIDKAGAVAGGYVEKKENVVNLLKQREGVASNQIMLKVRFAEVSRNALQELGVSFFADNRNSRWTGRTTTGQFAAPYFDKNQPSAALHDTMVFSDYLNLFLFDAKNSIGAAVKALQTRGVFQSLAEPNLVATNGKEASFLAGGEFPYPVPQGSFGSFTIQFKEYGVRLTFTPTVVGGDLINLKLAPEVSSLDFNNAIIIEGFRVPALTSRRTNTEIELRDGQTFAIAGLMNNSVLQSMRKVPGLGDIPILGHLFRSRAYQKEQTELVVMVTPHILRRDSTGVSEGLPSLVEPYIGPNPKPVPNPAPYSGSPYEQNLTPQRPVGGGDAAAAAAAPMPQPAPATVASTSANVPTRAVANPVPSTPIQGTAPLPERPAAPAETPKMTKAEKEFIEKEKERQRKQAEAEEKARIADAKRDAEEAKRQAEADKKAAKKAEEDRKKAEKIEKELAKKKAEADRKAAEQARKQQEEQQKKEKALQEAAERLKAAQAAYQAEVAKNKGGQQ